MRHAQSGLWLAPFRAYSPSLARWLSRDPLNGLDGLNPYAYVSNAPTVAYDPDGRWAFAIAGGLLGGLIGGAIEWWNGGDFIGHGMLRGAYAGTIAGGTFGPGMVALGGANAGFGATMMWGAFSAATGQLSTQGWEQIFGASCGTDWTAVGWSALFAGAGSGIGKGLHVLAARIAARSANGIPLNHMGPGAASPSEFFKKVVNSEMAHASERAVARAGFSSIKEAREALKAFGKKLEAEGLPTRAIADTAHADRIIVPGFGKDGAVVYQLMKNGTLRLKTVLNWIEPTQ
jgi:RHS repeat-associated protein